MFPSPHSGILFLWLECRHIHFRQYCNVSVPSFGDSFFIADQFFVTVDSTIGFRPLIRGFFFYRKAR